MKFTKLQKLQLNHSRRMQTVAVCKFVGELCNSEVRSACLSSYFIYDPRDHPQSEIDSITCEPGEKKKRQKSCHESYANTQGISVQSWTIFLVFYDPEPTPNTFFVIFAVVGLFIFLSC